MVASRYKPHDIRERNTSLSKVYLFPITSPRSEDAHASSARLIGTSFEIFAIRSSIRLQQSSAHRSW